jgi:hypothetical protein
MGKGHEEKMQKNTGRLWELSHSCHSWLIYKRVYYLPMKSHALRGVCQVRREGTEILSAKGHSAPVITSSNMRLEKPVTWQRGIVHLTIVWRRGVCDVMRCLIWELCKS